MNLQLCGACAPKTEDGVNVEEILTLENKVDFPSGEHEKEEIFEYFQEHNKELKLLIKRLKKHGKDNHIVISKKEGNIRIKVDDDRNDISSQIIEDEELMRVCKEFLETDFIHFIGYDDTGVGRTRPLIGFSYNYPNDNGDLYTYNCYLYYLGWGGGNPRVYEHVTGYWWYYWSPNI